MRFFFISDHFPAYYSQETIGKKKRLWPVCRSRAIVSTCCCWKIRYTGRDYTRVTVAVGIEMICRANRACLISFYIYFILFIINDFSKSIMTSNFLYMRDITVTHFIVKYTHNLTLSCNCFHNIVFYLIFISVWNIYFKFSIACLRINICNISC